MEEGRRKKTQKHYKSAIGNRQSKISNNPLHPLPPKNHPKISKNHPLDDTQGGPVWFKLYHLE
jgi:hypothetical protein